DFIFPLFITHERSARKEISSMPGQFQIGLDHLPAELDSIISAGIRGVILFGIPSFKDSRGTESLGEEGIIPQAVRLIKKHAPELYVITDVCLCEYTDHGHCGPVLENGEVDNDATLELIARQAVVHARAGADMVAPSGMMDGMVAAIRAGLDREHFAGVPVMSYAVKYASAFYGPFRDAAESAPRFGDRRSYQMDPPNRREALREAALDVEEGADILMVKPALAYLDIIREVRDSFDLPVAAYNVSGEFAMVHAAAQKGWIDGERVMLEMLTAIKRAGADLILTYFAREAAQLAARNS
ncbi:MAG TPA: porphobilinogen synthase, partial [Bacteroidetes bacterium]|nr:porphobilinogen synthase [Bacteroidota bacterium]